VQLLIEKGADVTATDGDENIVLHEAASREGKTVMQLLIKKEADTKAKNNIGDTALHLMIRHSTR